MEADPTARNLEEKLVWNPLAIYLTFWRFEKFVKPWVTREFQEPQEIFKSKLYLYAEIRSTCAEHFMLLSELRNHLQEIYDVKEGPSETDLNEAIKGILRIQLIYKLNSTDVGTFFCHVSCVFL